jgi:osmoprotectant transport system substrate-binding protein
VRARVAATVATIAVLTCASCTTTTREGRRSGGGGKGTIVVGVSGAFAENEIVAEMYAEVLQHAGYTVERQFDLQSREFSQNALDSGQIDLKPEYLSSLLLFLDPNAQPSNDPAQVAALDRALLASKGIDLLTPSPAQDTNVFVANAQTVRRYRLSTMTSLAKVAGHLTLGGPPECPERPFCLTELKRTYGILFDDFKPLDAGGPQTVAALKSDQVQVGLLFSTDPRIDANGFVPLIDDRHLQNAENLTPVIRADKMNDEIRAWLDGVSAKLTTQNVTKLVGKVVMGGQSVASVARGFLIANGLLETIPVTGQSG